ATRLPSMSLSGVVMDRIIGASRENAENAGSAGKRKSRMPWVASLIFCDSCAFCVSCAFCDYHPPMHAIILSIGDELVLGQTVDTNRAWLGDRLAGQGVAVHYHQTLADARPMIAEALQQAAQRADIVLVTGGLGPTDDDLTREALAEAM